MSVNFNWSETIFSMPRNRTHLSELEPGCTVRADDASIDRFVFHIHRADVTWSRELATRAIANLRSSRGLRRGRSPNVVDIGGSGLMMTGRVTFFDGPTPQAQVTLRLNLTEFLSQNFARLRDPEDIRILDQDMRRGLLFTTPPHGTSLDGNINFFTDAQRRTGRHFDHAEWVEPYVQLALAFLSHELELALDLDRHMHGRFPGLTFSPRGWSLRQIEMYWEFWSSDAVGRVSELCSTAGRITQDHTLSRYQSSEGRTGAALFLSARTSSQPVFFKIYSKLRDRIRVEIAYAKSVRGIERALPFRGRLDWFEVEPMVRTVAELATLRINTWLGAVLQAQEASAQSRGSSSAIAFLLALAEAFPSPEMHRMAWTHLLQWGSIPRRAFDLGLGTGVLRLVRTGYLVPSSPGRARINTAYRAADAYTHVVTGIRSSYDFTMRLPGASPNEATLDRPQD